MALVTECSQTVLVSCLPFYLRSDGEAELYRSADFALNQCIARAEQGGKWTFTDAERTALEALLRVHDKELAAVPVHRYLEVSTSDVISPEGDAAIFLD
ncbi:hypothetical protein LGM43_37075 [Burkholderia seminalis]|uniref:hypothetical protein n=1 Tax=Burkholderia seminalis TaxID=488731 RepID=UPI001CF1DA71|nr:hypothetical protein [Burkholderia seminalis]MCA7955833.1 hypothetical protein [Burkholderia seminalis]